MLRLGGEQRCLEAAAQRQSEPAGAVFGRRAPLIGSRGQPDRRPVSGVQRLLGDGGQFRVSCRGRSAVHLCAVARQGPVLLHRPQHVERQHVGGALPDGQHLGVAQQLRQVGVLDVARAAEGLQSLAGACHGLLARGQLRDGQQQAERGTLRVGGDPGLLTAEQCHGAEHQLQAGLVFDPQPRQRGLVQRMIDDRLPEGGPAAGVVTCQRQGSSQATGGDDRVPQPRDGQHRGDRAGAVRRGADQVRDGALQRQLRRGHLSGPELVLQP